MSLVLLLLGGFFLFGSLSDDEGSQVHSPTLMKKSGAWEGCWSQFHDAVVKGKLDTCRQLLTCERCSTPMCLGALSPAYRLRQMDSIAFSKLRTTALHMAALYRRPDFVQLLLEQGSEATVMDGFGRTPAAVLMEHWPRVTLPSSDPPSWDQHLSPPGRPHDSDTLLQLWAAPEEGGSSNHHHQCEMDTTAPRKDREMQLFREQVTLWRARSTRCLKLLLRHGLGVNDVADRRRASTLLHIAARYDLVDVIELILNNKDSGTLLRSEYSLEPCSCCHQERDGAAEQGHGSLSGKRGVLNSSRMILKRSASLPQYVKRAVARHMRSAVMRSHSCMTYWMWNNRRKNRLRQQGRHLTTHTCGQTVKRTVSSLPLIDTHGASGGAGKNSDLDAGDDEEEEEGEEEEEENSPQAAADLEVLNATAKTPLAVAVDRGSLNAAHCLLSYGADVFTSDFYGRSILHFLSERDITFDLLMQEVVRQGVDVDGVDNGSNTALHVAAYMGNISKVRFLLQAGASADRSNLAGKTPLFLACQRRDLAARHIIQLLLMSSVHVKVKDKLGRMPSLLQREENGPCRFLLEHLHRTSDTLLRRCVISVRRSIGFSRLMDISGPVSLPCPYFIQQAVFGEQERSIVDLLQM